MPKILKIYKDGSVYVEGGKVSIIPGGVVPVEEYDVSDFDEDEIETLKRNPKDKKLIKKARKLG